ncbi:glycosyltransferase [Candidatus Saccharibacteria bacterium]|nr:glycosyltransferase [Candidatus Saccharibacteria bacterium]
MKRNVTVVFVILHYLTENDTISCVDSIKKCVKRSKIIIIDNASKNGSGEAIKAKYSDDANIEVVLNNQNYGFARGNNIGIRIAKEKFNPDFVILCNNDTKIIDDDFLEKVSREYAESGYAVLGPSELLSNGNYYCPVKDIPTYHETKKFIRSLEFRIRHTRLFLYVDFFKKIIKKIVTFGRRDMKTTCGKKQYGIVLHGAFLVLSRKYLENFDGLDERTFLYGEEALLALSLRKRGLVSVYDPSIHILHNHHSATNHLTMSTVERVRKRAKYELDSAKILLGELEAEMMAKSQRKRFVTLFPRIEGFHLSKDVGMIPYAMQKYYDYNSGIVVYKGKDYSGFYNYVYGVSKLYFPLKKFNSIANCILFLLKSAKDIDVLHLYHIHVNSTFACVALYLMLNKKGLIYIHLDSGSSFNKDDVLSIRKKPIKSFIMKRIVFNKKNKKRILFGGQNMDEIRRLNGAFPFQNIRYVPNGYEDSFNDKYNMEDCKKENVILFVGRANDVKQKRIDLLLAAFIKVKDKIPQYKLRIVGEVSPHQREEIKKLSIKNDLKDRIEIVGHVSDRRKLMKEYSIAKILCLPSDFESFGLVLLEALDHGCLIVGSNIPTTTSIVGEDKYGYLFNAGDAEDLALKLCLACSDNMKMKYVQENGKKYVMRNYSYKKILKVVDDWIRSKK